ncbi:unnamed protein product, partial [Adineta ricciae]
LTFEQSITNLLEKESPLLQSELLTAEHELSVLRSRLAVNEGVTAVTGTILESLKEQFEPHHKVDIATSPLDIYKHSLFNQSLAVQTSPMIESFPEIPESVEIHYDAQAPKSPYLLVKAKNLFWIAQPIPVSEAETHLQKFSSPVMKRATVKLPPAFDQTFLTDSETEEELVAAEEPNKRQPPPVEEKPLTIENVQRLADKHLQKLKQSENSWSMEVIPPSVVEETNSPTRGKSTHQDSVVTSAGNLSTLPIKPTSELIEEDLKTEISPEDQRSFPDVKEQISEMKTIRSSSLLQIEDQIEQFDDKIDELYSIIDYLKNNQFTAANFQDTLTKIHDLKALMSDIQLSKTDELRIEYELDELENLFQTINENLQNNAHQEDYSLIELFEQNVNELRRIINDIKSSKIEDLQSTRTDIVEQESKVSAENDWTPEQMAEYFHRGPDGRLLSPRQSQSHLIPEDPVITRDVFFEGDKPPREKKTSLTHTTHLIPEEARISADSFYEGDIHRSFYHKETKDKDTSEHEKPLIPESPLVSGDVFYEGDPHRSLFIERAPSIHAERQLRSPSPPPSIDNLREIMSDLMLAASWTKKPTKIEEQSGKEDEEILAESFITTEQRHPPATSYEIVHEIENFPLSSSAIQIEEPDTISPFSAEIPIVIHRTILTRQETENWPQEESQMIEETTGELEKITHEVRSHAQDWIQSSNQRKEVYGEQYRPERRFSEEFPPITTLQQQSTTSEMELKQPTEEIEDETIEDVSHDYEHRDENDQSHIERTWSTDKIFEPSSTMETEHESSIRTPDQTHEKLISDDTTVEQEQDQQSGKFYIGTLQDIKQEETSADQHEVESDVQDRHELQSELSSEKVAIDEVRFERKPSVQQIITGSTEHIEDEDEKHEEPNYSSQQHISVDQAFLRSSLIDDKGHQDDQFSSDKGTVIIPGETFEQERRDIEDDHKLEPRRSSERAHTESPQPSEHEEDDHQVEDKMKFEVPVDKNVETDEKSISRKVSTTSSRSSKHEEDVLESSQDIQSHMYEKEKRLSAEESPVAAQHESESFHFNEHTIESSRESEHNDDEQTDQDFPEEKRRIEQISVTPLNVVEHEEDKHELVRTPSVEEPHSQSPRPSEHEQPTMQTELQEEDQHEEHHYEQERLRHENVIQSLSHDTHVDETYEQQLARTPSSEKSLSNSHRFSEHEEQEEQQLEQQSNIDHTVVHPSSDFTYRQDEHEQRLTRTPSVEKLHQESPYISEPEEEEKEYLEQRSNIHQTSVSSVSNFPHTEIELEHELARTSSSEKLRSHSPQISEHGEQGDHLEQQQQRNAHESRASPSSDLPHEEEDHQQSSVDEMVVQPTSEFTYHQDEHGMELVLTPSTEEIRSQPSHISEHEEPEEEEQQQQHRFERQPSIEKSATETVSHVTHTDETYEQQLVRTPSVEQLRSESSQSSKHEKESYLEQPEAADETNTQLSSQAKHIEETHEQQLIRTPSIDKSRSTSIHSSEHEEYEQHENEHHLERQTNVYNAVLSPSAEFTHTEKERRQELPWTPSVEEPQSLSRQSSEHEEIEVEHQLERQAPSDIIHVEDEQKQQLMQTPSIEKPRSASIQSSEHDEEPRLERQASIDKTVIPPSADFAQVADEHKEELSKTSVVEQHRSESPQCSEHEEYQEEHHFEQQLSGEKILATGFGHVEAEYKQELLRTPSVEEHRLERQSSIDKTVIPSSADFIHVDEKHKEELLRTPSIEEPRSTSRQSSEHEEQVEEEHQHERQSSIHDIVTEQPPHTTHVEDEYKQELLRTPSVEQQPHSQSFELGEDEEHEEHDEKEEHRLERQSSIDKTVIPSSADFIHVDEKHKEELLRTPNIEELRSTSRQSSEHEEQVKEEHQHERQPNIDDIATEQPPHTIHVEDEQKQQLAQSPTNEKSLSASLQFSEHEEEHRSVDSESEDGKDEENRLERQRSLDRIVSTQPPHVTHAEDEHTEEQLLRTPSIEEPRSKSPRYSEHEEEENHDEQERYVDEAHVQPMFDVKHTKQEQLVRTPSVEKVLSASLQSSEHEEEIEEPHLKREPSTDKTSVQPSQSTIGKEHQQEHETAFEQSPVISERSIVYEEDHQSERKSEFSQQEPEAEEDIVEKVVDLHTEQQHPVERINIESSPMIEEKEFQHEQFSIDKETAISPVSATLTRTDMKSPQFSEHEDEEDQFEKSVSSKQSLIEEEYVSERPTSLETVHRESRRSSEDDHGHQYEYQQHSITEQTHAESPASSEDKHDIQVLKPEHIAVDTHQSVEPEEEKYQSERKVSSDQINMEPSPKVEQHKDFYERYPSTQSAGEEKSEVTDQSSLQSSQHIAEEHFVADDDDDDDNDVIMKTSHEDEKEEISSTVQPSKRDSHKSTEDEEHETQRRLSEHRTSAESLPSSDTEMETKEDRTRYEKQSSAEQVPADSHPTAEGHESAIGTIEHKDDKMSDVKFIVASAPSSSFEEDRESQDFNLEPSHTTAEDRADAFEQRHDDQDKSDQKVTVHDTVAVSSHEAEQHPFGREESTEEIITKSSPTIETIPQTFATSPDETEKYETRIEHDYKPVSYPSSERIDTRSPPATEHDEDQYPDEFITEEVKSETEDMHKLEEEKPTPDESFTQSSHEDDGELPKEVIHASHISDAEEEEQYQSEHEHSTDHLVAEEVSPIIESKHFAPSTSQDEEELPSPSEQRRSSIDQLSAEPTPALSSKTSSAKTEEEATEQEFARRLSVDKVSNKSRVDSESEEERRDEESKAQPDQDILASSQELEEHKTFDHSITETHQEETNDFTRLLSAEQVALSFPQILNEGQVERSPSVEKKSSIESPDEHAPEDHHITETSPKQQYPYESFPSQDEPFHMESAKSFEREISDENFANVQSSVRSDEDEVESEQLKRPEPWTQSAFQREEIYGDKYRPAKYALDSPVAENPESSLISHVQHSSIISRTIPSYQGDEELEHEDEDDFRPTHLDISLPVEQDKNLFKTSTPDTEYILSKSDRDDQYEKVLEQTSQKFVSRILDEAVNETVEQDRNYSLYQTATGIVNDVLDNVYTKYDDEIPSSQRDETTSADVSISDLTDWSSLVKNVPDAITEEKPTQLTSSGSDRVDVEKEEEHLTSDDEEKDKSIENITGEPYLSITDAATAKSTHELADLMQELHKFEQEINDNIDIIRSSSPSASSSMSDNDEIRHYDVTIPPVIELQPTEDNLHLPESTTRIVDQPDKATDAPEQHDEKALQSASVDSLSRDILQYRHDSQSGESHQTERRPSSPPGSPLLKNEFVHVTCSSMSDVDEAQKQLQHEQDDHPGLQKMIIDVIQQARVNVQGEHLDIPQIRKKSIPTLSTDQRRAPHIQSSGTSISDDLDYSHEDSTGDRSSELAAQLDYLRRMSRYEHLMDEQQQRDGTEADPTDGKDNVSQTTVGDEEAEFASNHYLKSVREEQLPSDEDEDDEMKKKSKRQSITDDHDKSLSEHHDSDDDDDDHDHKGDKPLVSSITQETTSSESQQQQPSTSNESNQKQTYQSSHQQQQQQQSQQEMEMSTDSINEEMIISQDSLKQQSSDSLDSEQELKIISPKTPVEPPNETYDFIVKQHQSEPTPSQMMKKYYDDDESNDLKPSANRYPLISNEIDIGQLPVIHARRTASENSLFSTSSTPLHMYDGHSLSASCLTDKDELTPSNEYMDDQQQILYDESQKNQQIYRETTRKDVDDDNLEFNPSSSPSTSAVGFFDRVKAFVAKPVEIVQEVMENRRKQRSTSSLNSNSDFTEKQLVDNENESLTSSPQQHFHSAYELHDDEQNKLVRSPELYEIDNINNLDQTTLPHLHAQNRTQSEVVLPTNGSKRDSLVAANNEVSEGFLPTISKDNSLEFIHQQHQRHSTPYDDAVEKESSPEHSESCSLPTSAFLDTFEPTSSCQRPLALNAPGQQLQEKADETMTEEEFDILTSDYVNQVLTDVVAQMTGEHDDSSHSNKSDHQLGDGTSSDDDDDDDEDELREEGEDEHKQSQIPTDTSSFGFNDHYSADESSNTRDQSADEDHSARSSTTTTPTKNLRHSYTDAEILNLEQSPKALSPLPPPPVIVRHGSQSDTGTYFSAISPSSGGEYVDVRSTNSTVDDDKVRLQPPTQSNSSQYLTADDETPNFLTSDDNDYADESGTINPGYDDSSSDEKQSNETQSLFSSTTTNEKLREEKYSGEGEESSGGNQEATQRRKRSNEQRFSLLNDATGNLSENISSKSVSFKLDTNDISPRSPRLPPGSSGFTSGNFHREESVDSLNGDSNEKQLIKSIQEEILRTNLATLKTDLELGESQTYPLASTPPLESPKMQTTTKTVSHSDYDAGSESDRDSSLLDSIKSTIHIQLDDIYQEKETLIDQIKLKFERSLDRLIEKTLAGDDDTNKSDIISPFTDQSLNQSLPTSEPAAAITTTTATNLIHAHSEQQLQACPDELDYGTLQRFSSDSCIIIRVPEQYTPSSTLFFDQLKAEQLEQKPTIIEKPTSAFSFYTKQELPQPSSSPIEMLTVKTELIENISPINRYTPRSLDDSALDFGERDIGDVSDEFVLVKNSSPSTNPKEIKTDTPSNSSSSSSDKHESPDLIDILQHQCEYPPLDTGFDLRSGTTLETVYESPELRQDEIKPALSTLSLTTSDILRPYSTEHNSSNTPNTDDSLMEFERIEMELLKNPSSTNVTDAAREIRSSVDLLIQQHETNENTNNNNKVESFIEKHFSSVDNDVQNVLNDILDMAGDLTNSISS